MEPRDHEYMTASIEEARRSTAEDGRIHPKVGVVVVLRDDVLARTHRGDRDENGAVIGAHAEYIALEGRLSDVSLAGATVFTTLEPCTERGDGKVACARRLIERRVLRVVIGMLDPNPAISGRGVRMLRDAGVTVELFSREFAAQVEELNREFLRAYPVSARRRDIDRTQRVAMMLLVAALCAVVAAGFWMWPRTRRLSDGQITALAKELRNRPSGKLVLEWQLGDPEAAAFAQDLKRAMILGGWNLPRQNERQIVPVDSKGGLWVKVGSKTPPPRAAALQSALKARGFVAMGMIVEREPEDFVGLRVESRE